ncbi:MAG: hypothetical protein ACRDDF_11760, partial [Aeromonas sp.]
MVFGTSTNNMSSISGYDHNILGAFEKTNSITERDRFKLDIRTDFSLEDMYDFTPLNQFENINMSSQNTETKMEDLFSGKSEFQLNDAVNSQLGRKQRFLGGLADQKHCKSVQNDIAQLGISGYQFTDNLGCQPLNVERHAAYSKDNPYSLNDSSIDKYKNNGFILLGHKNEYLKSSFSNKKHEFNGAFDPKNVMIANKTISRGESYELNLQDQEIYETIALNGVSNEQIAICNDSNDINQIISRGVFNNPLKSRFGDFDTAENVHSGKNEYKFTNQMRPMPICFQNPQILQPPNLYITKKLKIGSYGHKNIIKSILPTMMPHISQK